MTDDRLTADGSWVPAEPLPEPFGILWGRLWNERRSRGERTLSALVRSWRDARAISRISRA